MLLFMAGCHRELPLEYTIRVVNPSEYQRISEPVEIDLAALDLNKRYLHEVFLLTKQLETIPFQLDDLNGDGVPELSFLCDLEGGEVAEFRLSIEKANTHDQVGFTDKTWCQLMPWNEWSQTDSFGSAGGPDSGEFLHHGLAIENGEIAYRMLDNDLMTIDVYGKENNVLELRQTNWDPDSIQRSAGYGRGILETGDAIGVGSLRFWDGSEALPIPDVTERTASLRTFGPVKAVVEMESTVSSDGLRKKTRILSRLTLYNGHHDYMHELFVSGPVPALCTGIMKNPEATCRVRTGFVGWWGERGAGIHSAMPDSMGLGVIIGTEYMQKFGEDPKNMVLILDTHHREYFKWFGVARWQMEKNGICSEKEFFGYLETLNDHRMHPVEVQIVNECI